MVETVEQLAAVMANWRKHIDWQVATAGQWVGLCDENGIPILDVAPVVALSGGETRGTSASCEVSVAVTPDSPLVAELIGAGVAEPLAHGRLELAGAKARLVVIERKGKRDTFLVTHTVATGVHGPTMLTIHGVDLLEGLSAWPCPSIPIVWQQANFTKWDTDASGQTYSAARDLAHVEFATAADGYTVSGPAATVVRTLIQDSLDAVNAVMRWDRHMIVEMPDTVDTSQELLIRTSDDSVWDTIAEPAHNAGLTISVDLWWPGDQPVRCKQQPSGDIELAEFRHPMQIVRVEEVK